MVPGNDEPKVGRRRIKHSSVMIAIPFMELLLKKERQLSVFTEAASPHLILLASFQMDYVSTKLLESRRVILNRTDLLEWMLIARGLRAGCNFKNGKQGEKKTFQVKRAMSHSGQRVSFCSWKVGIERNPRVCMTGFSANWRCFICLWTGDYVFTLKTGCQM